MSKIAFFCIPAHGHTNPTLEVVKELIARGNEVWYYSYDSMKSKIESTGAVYISCDKYDIQMKPSFEGNQRLVTDIAFSTQVIVNTTLAMDEAIYEQMKDWDPDCIVADSMAFWGKLTALKLQVPFVSSTTTFAFNRYSSKIMKRNSNGLLKTLFSMAKANKIMKKLKGKGYPVKNVLSIIANDNETNTVVYTSKQFQPYAETFSERYTFVGPSVKKNSSIPQTRKRPCIYISLGTVLNDNLFFYKNCLEAFKDSELEVVISAGETFDIKNLGIIPENFRVEQSVNQIEVLQQAEVFLTHCGMNSVSEALYYAVPLILFPQTTEQGGVAYRVNELGAGMYLEENNPQAIKAAVNEVRSNPEYKKNAKVIADNFHSCGGAALAADKIIAVAKHKQKK